MAKHSKFRLKEGSAEAHSAIWDGTGTNFTLFSANASKVELCLFDSAGKTETDRIVLPEYTDLIWHGYLSDVHPGPVYGFRVYVQNAPSAVQHFNPNKLLLD